MSIDKHIFYIVIFSLFAGNVFAEDLILDDWYIGFGIGKQDSYFETDGNKITLDEWFSGADNQDDGSFNFQLGQRINPSFLLGGTIIHNGASGSIPGVSARLSETNLFLTGTYFPFKNGWHLRSGAGVSVARQEVLTNFSADIDGEWYGVGGLIGTGYYIRIGKSFGLSVNFDLIRSKYKDQTGPDVSGSNMLYVAAMWY